MILFANGPIVGQIATEINVQFVFHNTRDRKDSGGQVPAAVNNITAILAADVNV